MLFEEDSFLEKLGFAFKVRIGDERVPGDEECGVVVRGMAVILDVLALLPDTEVVEGRGSVEAHCGSFLFWMKHHWECDQETGYAYCKIVSSSCSMS